LAGLKSAFETPAEVVARGVRQSVGFDWHPATKELYFSIGRSRERVPRENLFSLVSKDLKQVLSAHFSVVRASP
jgi:hypothetical protein